LKTSKILSPEFEISRTMGSEDSSADDSWESELEEDLESEEEEEDQFLEPQQIVDLATIDTRVLILEGQRDDTLCNFRKKKYEDFVNNIIWECWESYHEEDLPLDYSGPKIGPDCHLCGEEIIPDDYLITINGDIYKVIWKEEVKEEEHSEEVGMLQCVFCFNFYHRHKCSLFLSHTSYFGKKLAKSWSCPTCIPVFVPTKKNVQKISKSELLVSIFKFVCKLAQKEECSFNVNLDDNLDVLKQIIKITNEFDLDNG